MILCILYNILQTLYHPIALIEFIIIKIKEYPIKPFTGLPFLHDLFLKVFKNLSKT
jgi:hypothetical protein